MKLNTLDSFKQLSLPWENKQSLNGFDSSLYGFDVRLLRWWTNVRGWPAKLTEQCGQRRGRDLSKINLYKLLLYAKDIWEVTMEENFE